MLFEVFLLLVIVVMGVVGFGTWYFAPEQRIRRALANANRFDIREVKTGQVAKIVGSVRTNGKMLKSPFSRRKCVLYEAIVEERRSSGKSSKWVTIIRDREATDFFVEDDTGRALVRGADLKVVSDKDQEISSGMWNDATPDLEAFLAKHGHSSKGWIFNKTLRYKEGIFEPQETIAVLGTMKWEHDPDPDRAGRGYRDTPKRVVVEPLPDGFVLASDRPETY